MAKKKVQVATLRHPIQPLGHDGGGVLRFKENKIVRHLLGVASRHGVDMSELAILDFTQEDREQFAQLIGYSLDGFGELPYVRNETYEAAALMAESPTTSHLEARLDAATNIIEALKKGLRGPIAEFFCIHPDDLK